MKVETDEAALEPVVHAKRHLAVEVPVDRWRVVLVEEVQDAARVVHEASPVRQITHETDARVPGLPDILLSRTDITRVGQPGHLYNLNAQSTCGNRGGDRIDGYLGGHDRGCSKCHYRVDEELCVHRFSRRVRKAQPVDVGPCQCVLQAGHVSVFWSSFDVLGRPSKSKIRSTGVTYADFREPHRTTCEGPYVGPGQPSRPARRRREHRGGATHTVAFETGWIYSQLLQSGDVHAPREPWPHPHPHPLRWPPRWVRSSNLAPTVARPRGSWRLPKRRSRGWWGSLI